MLRRTLLTVAIAATVVAPAPLQAQPQAARTAPLTTTADGHFTIPVEVNGRGPFPFVVDTAASHTVVSAGLAADLGLPAVDSAHARMHGAGGSHTPQLHRIDSLSGGVFGPVSVVAAALPHGSGANHAGVLGMPPFAEGRLEFDLAARTLRFGPSGAAPAGHATIKGRRALGTFLFVEVVIDGVRATALVDSGARRTLANPVLQRALGIAADDSRLSADTAVSGATAHRIPTMRGAVGSLQLGQIAYRKPVIAFADLPVFATLGIGDQPALILGADLLGKSRAFAVDYPRAELQILN